MLKEVIVLIGILILLATIPTVIAPYWFGTEDGLVSHWTCDGHFNDRISSNDGTQSGGVSIGRGVKGRGCEFDGVDDYIQITKDVSINQVNMSGHFSGAAWIYPIGWGESNEGRVFSKRTGGYELLIDNNGRLQVYIPHITTAAYVITVGGVSLNTWQHVAFVYNESGNNEIKIYSNGVKQTEGVSNITGVGGLSDDSSNDLYIGQYPSGIREFNGTIDEVRIYNTSLSASEIQTLYNSSRSYHLEFKSQPTLGISNETPAPTINDESGLVGHWKFNTNADDSSGEGNDGTLFGGIANTTGRWSEAYEFDGDDGYVNTTADASLRPANVTLSAWIYAKEDKSVQFIAGYGNTGNKGYWLGWEGNGIEGSVGNGTVGERVYHQPSTSLNQWHHTVLTYNNTAVMLYIDGVLEDTQTAIDGDIDYTGLVNFKIGQIDGMSATRYWNGTIDEIRIYNRSLSSSEVKDLYVSKGLVGKWTFDSKDGSDSNFAMDTSGYENNGTVTGAKFTNEGRFKEGYEFAGNADYIHITDEASLDFGTGNFTISLWKKGYTSTGRLISKRNVNYGYELLDRNNLISVLIGDGSATHIDVGTTNIVDDLWHHIVAVWDSSIDNVTVYLDGVKDGESNYGTKGSIDTNANFTIGTYPPSGQDYDGIIDEVKIFNRALTASEVAGMYNGTKSHHVTFFTMPTLGLANESGLVGYWTFDTKDGSNSTNATDKSGEGNDGTVTGATFTNLGRFKEGYSFDGGNNYIENTDFSVSSNASISVFSWIYPKSLVNYAGVVTTLGNNPFPGWALYVHGSGEISTYLGSHRQGNTIPLNTWSLIGFTYNGSNLSYYSNGALVNSYSGVSYNNNTGLRIGDFGETGSLDDNFNGSIDEVRIYNRSLSASEVAGLYNGTKTQHFTWYGVPG